MTNNNTAANSHSEFRLTQFASATNAYRIWYMTPGATVVLMIRSLFEEPLNHASKHLTKDLVSQTHRFVSSGDDKGCNGIA